MAKALTPQEQARIDFREGKINADAYVKIVAANPIELFPRKPRVTIEETATEIIVTLHGPPLPQTNKRFRIIREGEEGGAGTGRRK
jgi:hypothetical protein